MSGEIRRSAVDIERGERNAVGSGALRSTSRHRPTGAARLAFAIARPFPPATVGADPSAGRQTEPEALDEYRLRRLIEVGRSLVSELDLEAVLDRVLDVAREVTGARYAALRIADDEGDELERYILSGIAESTHRAVGELPRGRAIRGETTRHPAAAAVTDSPLDGGCSPAVSLVIAFLGAPVLIRGAAYGNLYVTDKDGGRFTPEDEAALIVLAEWAAIAVENAKLYADLEDQRTDLEWAVRRLEATTTIARAVGDETDLARVLELIVGRARALVEARAVLILIEEDGMLRLAATAGQARAPAAEFRLPITDSLPGAILRGGRPERLADLDSTGRLGLGDFAGEAMTALLVPLSFRGRSSGLLVAFDRLAEDPQFGAEDERLLSAFAASAGTAVATAQTVEVRRLRDRIQAAEAERGRWARELHDETLQGLGALQVLLTSGRRRPGGAEEVAEQAMVQLEEEIARLQALITELRPAALDEIGLGPAVTALMKRAQVSQAAEVELDLDLDYDSGRAETRLDADIESTVFRLVQEALTNVAKHAAARHVEVAIIEAAGIITASVADDGIGFDPERTDGGFGLLGMRERVSLVGGEVTVWSMPGEGTCATATIPARHAQGPAGPPPAEPPG